MGLDAVSFSAGEQERRYPLRLTKKAMLTVMRPACIKAMWDGACSIEGNWRGRVKSGLMQPNVLYFFESQISTGDTQVQIPSWP